MSKIPKIYIPCCDESLPIIKINSYLFNKLWPEAEVHYLGFQKPDYEFYNKNHFFHSMAPKQEGGASRWTRYLHEFLSNIEDESIIFSIDDYWLCQKPNTSMIELANSILKGNPKVGRFDLTFDSHVEGNFIPAKTIGVHQVSVKDPRAQYRISTQPAGWNLKFLLEILDNDWSPWQFELNGSSLASKRYPDSYHTFCFTDQSMIEYPLRTIAKGAVSRHNPGKYNVLGLPIDIIRDLVKQKFFTEQQLIWGQWNGNVPTFYEKGGYDFDPSSLPRHEASKTNWREYYCIYPSAEKVNLFDSCFSHTKDLWGYVSSNGNNHWGKPKNINYVLKQNSFNNITIFTDHYLGNREFIKSIDSPKKVAWICEPPSIHSWAYESISKTHDLFDLIVSYDSSLAEKYDNCVHSIIMETRLKPEECGIHKKANLISLIASNKKMSDGHRFRFDIANKFANKYNIDLWGSAFVKFDLKSQPLKNYCFSITVHNCKINDFYTEALVDCFLAGTVPIFWGCPNIGDYFDSRGILSFDTLGDLEKILNDVSFELYDSMEPYIRNNFEIAKKHQVTKDDQLIDVIKRKFDEN